jgi:hypothetical protein
MQVRTKRHAADFSYNTSAETDFRREFSRKNFLRKRKCSSREMCTKNRPCSKLWKVIFRCIFRSLMAVVFDNKICVWTTSRLQVFTVLFTIVGLDLANPLSKDNILSLYPFAKGLKMKKWIFQYLPHLTSVYLFANLDPDEKRSMKFLEAFFLSVYNSEALDTQQSAQQQQSR